VTDQERITELEVENADLRDTIATAVVDIAAENEVLRERCERLRRVAFDAQDWDEAEEDEDEQRAKRALDRLSHTVAALQPGDLIPPEDAE
jgi:hypothetical protein